MAKRREVSEKDLRDFFDEGARMILDVRTKFDQDWEAAESDSQRHTLATALPRDLGKLYGRIDGILDAYLEMRASEQLQQRMSYSG